MRKWKGIESYHDTRLITTFSSKEASFILTLAAVPAMCTMGGFQGSVFGEGRS